MSVKLHFDCKLFGTLENIDIIYKCTMVQSLLEGLVAITV